jgi:hypothetical protein
MTHRSFPDLSAPPVNEQQARREFLKQLSAASAAAWMGAAPRMLSADEGAAEAPKATADACIVLWMAGGMAAPETFDPSDITPSRWAHRSRR